MKNKRHGHDPTGKGPRKPFIYMARPQADMQTRRPATPRRKRVRVRSLSRRVLAFACLEEIRCGGNGVTTLYAGLLMRAVADADPQIGEEFLGCLRALNED